MDTVVDQRPWRDVHTPIPTLPKEEPALQTRQIQRPMLKILIHQTRLLLRDPKIKPTLISLMVSQLLDSDSPMTNRRRQRRIRILTHEHPLLNALDRLPG